MVGSRTLEVTALSLFGLASILGWQSGELWVGIQTGALVATAVVVWMYTHETQKLRLATDVALQIAKQSGLADRLAGRALVRMELRALMLQIGLWLDLNPTGHEHGLHVWLSHLRKSPEDLVPYLRRAESHLKSSVDLARHLDPKEVEALEVVTQRFYSALQHLDRMMPDHQFWKRQKDLHSDSTVNQAETALEDSRRHIVALLDLATC